MCFEVEHYQKVCISVLVLPEERQTVFVLCWACPGAPLSTHFSHRCPTLPRERSAGFVHCRPGLLLLRAVGSALHRRMRHERRQGA